MDKRISTLVFIFVIYFLIAVTMCLFAPAQQFFTMLFFSITGVGIFLLFFFLWLAHRSE
jgi:hypothetical protein